MLFDIPELFVEDGWEDEDCVEDKEKDSEQGTEASADRGIGVASIKIKGSAILSKRYHF